MRPMEETGPVTSWTRALALAWARQDELRQRADAAFAALDQSRELLTELSRVAVEWERRAHHWEAQYDTAIRRLARGSEHRHDIERSI